MEFKPFKLFTSDRVYRPVLLIRGIPVIEQSTRFTVMVERLALITGSEGILQWLHEEIGQFYSARRSDFQRTMVREICKSLIGKDRIAINADIQRMVA